MCFVKCGHLDTFPFRIPEIPFAGNILRVLSLAVLASDFRSIRRYEKAAFQNKVLSWQCSWLERRMSRQARVFHGQEPIFSRVLPVNSLGEVYDAFLELREQDWKVVDATRGQLSPMRNPYTSRCECILQVAVFNYHFLRF